MPRVQVTQSPGRRGADKQGPREIGPGLYLWVPAEVTLEPKDGVPYHLKLTIDLREGRADCVALEVKSLEGEPINGTGLRSIPVASILAKAVPNLVMRGKAGEGHMSYEPYYMPEEFTAGPTDEALRAVAAAYSVAYVLGEPPAKAVQRDLGLATSTAGRWIKLARERGFLEITADKGRRA